MKKYLLTRTDTIAYSKIKLVNQQTLELWNYINMTKTKMTEKQAVFCLLGMASLAGIPASDIEISGNITIDKTLV